MKVVILQLGGTRIRRIALNYETKTGSMLVLVLIIVSSLIFLALLLQMCSLVELSIRNLPPITFL